MTHARCRSPSGPHRLFMGTRTVMLSAMIIASPTSRGGGPPILVPYLVLFFGAILLMGLPMYRVNLHLWLVTVATTVLLLGSMGVAMRRGVG